MWTADRHPHGKRGHGTRHRRSYNGEVPDRLAEITVPDRSVAQGVGMAGPRRIALLMSQDAGFHRQVLLGIRAYAGQTKRWLFHNAPPTPAVLRPLAEWNPHGIIAHLDDAKVARAVLKLGKPVVDTANMLDGLGVPAVDVDPVAVGQLAAEYFLSRGHRHFGYFGSGWARYSQLRLASFREAVERAGFEVHACHVEYRPHLPERASWKSVNAQVRQWLSELAKPVAVLADHDVAAHALADMCQILGLSVPGDVAILGVDDDELECQLAFPPISSVAIPAAADRLRGRQTLGSHACRQAGVARGPCICRRFES